MFRTDRLVAIILGGALAAIPALSQEADKSEVSVQAFGSFVKTTTSNGVQQNATNSGGVLASYRFFFTGNQGVEVNYGYSRNSQFYSSPAGALGGDTDQHEFTAAYVIRHRMHSITPFAEAGVGAVLFNPVNSFDASKQARAAFVYGAGADVSSRRRQWIRSRDASRRTLGRFRLPLVSATRSRNTGAQP
jgi:hypothetical protein